MTEIPFCIVFTKPNKQKITTILTTDTGKDLEDIKNKIILMIIDHFNSFNNFPESYDDFISRHWYEFLSADAPPFQYKVLENDRWTSPWSDDELYDLVVERLHKLELLAAHVNEANQDSEQFEDEEEVVEE
jgi:hypothetical protein